MSALVRMRSWIADAFDRPSPTVKQAATAGGMLAALAVLFFVPGVDISDPALAGVGVALVASATILAVFFTNFPRFDRLVMIVPVIDIIALGCFRGGTGGGSSVFVSLLILPVIWLASGNGRRHIAYTGLLTAFALFIPFLIGATHPSSTADAVRGLFTPLVFVVGAGIINELARQGRAQLESIKSLADDKERMLQRTVEFAAQLQTEMNRMTAQTRSPDVLRELFEALGNDP
ncbi:MAG: hypothetical protein ABL886_11310, partial [Rhodoglobus sp.]